LSTRSRHPPVPKSEVGSRWEEVGCAFEPRASPLGAAEPTSKVRILYFGTYERDYPRNAQVIAALRNAGVEVNERHVSVWERSTHNWRAGAGAAARLVLAEAELLRRPDGKFDALIVGYPGHLDLTAARRAAAGRPVVFNPLVSLSDTLVGDRRRFGPRSP